MASEAAEFCLPTSEALGDVKRLRQIGQLLAVSLPPLRNGTHHPLSRPLIVSLTSYPARFGTLHLTLRSLLNQDVKPDCTVLWIAHTDHCLLPRSVLALQEAGVTIRVCDDLRSYKKIVPLLSRAPDAYIVTADDDTYYPRAWLRRFIENFRNAREILCQRARRIALENGGFAPYKTWETIKKAAEGPHVFPTGIGGVFYPPGALGPDTLRSDRFLELCPTSDDVWLYWMAKAAGSSHRMIEPTGKFTPWPTSQRSGLWRQNITENQNDRQIRRMLKHYGMPQEKSLRRI